MTIASPLAALLLASSTALAAFALPQSAFAQAAPADHAYTSKTPKLDRPQLDALLAQPDKIVIIDVRRPDEVSANGGFPVYLSIQAKELEKDLAWIPRDRQVVTVSNHAGRAGPAADLLASKGFHVVGAVGAQDYEAAGGTLTKPAKPPATAAAGTAPVAAAH